MSSKTPASAGVPQWVAIAVVVVLIIGFGAIWSEVRSMNENIRALASENEQLAQRLTELAQHRPAALEAPRRDSIRDDPPPPDEPPIDAPGGPEDQFESCTGRVPREVVSATLEENAADIQSCSRANPEVRGSLLLEILLDESGTMTGARVSGEVEDRALLECLMEIWREYRFPVEEGVECSIAPLRLEFPIP